MKIKTPLVWVTVLVASAGTASAKRPPLFHQQVADNSQRAALGTARMNVLQRRAGQGRKAAADKLLAKLESEGLAKSGAEHRSDDTEALLLDAVDWRLQTRGTGDWAHYENLARTRLLKEQDGVPPDQKPTLGQLEGPARDFIKRVLSDVVQLGPNETLEAWSVTHQTGVNGDVRGAQQAAVVATKIGFTRAIGGVAVLGAGSKVGVTFDTHGQVLGFELDWPVYAPMVSKGLNDSEPTVDVATVRQRVTKVRGARKFAKLIEEQPLECGYFDPGALAGAGAGIRGACQVRYMTSDAAGHVHAGYVDTVPIGEQIVNDSSWPEAVLLRK